VKRAAASLVAGALVALAAPAGATGFTDIGQDIVPRQKFDAKLDGYLRMRGEALSNLDLDRGPTPSGQLLFPVSLADPRAQTLTHWDMRMRTDLAVYAPGQMLAVKVRADLLDNLALGSVPEGIPSATTTQRSPGEPLRIKRAYGEALLPFGVLAAGRMGSQWGLGMLTNGGDCLDCDSGDAADRIALLLPLAGHIWAVAYDFSATLPVASRRAPGRTIALEPSAAVRTFTFAMLRHKDEDARARRQRADKTTVEYGGYLSYRWQNDDVPATYLPTSQPVAITDAQVMARGYRASAFDAWARLTFPFGRIEAEAAVLFATIDQPSLVPGVLLPQPAKSRQIGAAIESELGPKDMEWGLGVDMGYASGDPAPGFGVNVPANGRPPKAGDLDGAQATPPGDYRADNFRFHPDYRIDRILFREIVGAVTDATYVRPHARWRLAQGSAGSLTASVAAVGSMAVYAASAPGGSRPLGIEVDPTLAYEAREGFRVALEDAVLFPLEGLDNPALRLQAKPAHLVRLRLAFVF
jgi:uncharacterized protein (TIGR04551 family)